MTADPGAESDSPIRRPLIVAVVLIHVLFVLAPLDVLSPVDPGAVGDLILSGQVPYQDFAFEYPPLAVLAFLLPGLVPTTLGINMLAIQAVVLEVVLAVYVLRRHDGALLRYGVLSLLVFPFLSGGFDAIVMVAIALSTELLRRGDPGGWWIAAVGVATKLTPASTWVWGRARLGVGLVAGLVAGAVALSPMLLVGWSTDSWVGYSRERGVQAESVAASLAWAGKSLSGAAIEFEYRFRAWELVDAETAGYVMLGVGAVMLVVIAVHSRPKVDPWLLAYASILVVMLGNKVLSPQFMAWPAPLAAVLGRRWFVAHVLLCVGTAAIYMGPDDLEQLSPLIAGRNLLLVGVSVVALWTLVRQARSEGARSQHVDSVVT